MKFLGIKNLWTHALIQKKKKKFNDKKIDEILHILHKQLSAKVEK